MAAIARRGAKASSPVISRLERVEEWVDILGDDELKVEEMRGCLPVVGGVRKESALKIGRHGCVTKAAFSKVIRSQVILWKVFLRS